MTEKEQWEALAAIAFRTEPPSKVGGDRETILTEKKRSWARILCQNATDKTSLILAERLVKEWFNCNCEDVQKWSLE